MTTNPNDVAVKGKSAPVIDPALAYGPLFQALPGIEALTGEPVSITVPSINTRISEIDWKALLSADEDSIRRRRLFLEYIQALLNLVQTAKSEGKPLATAVKARGELCRQTLEKAWVAILTQNRERERAVRWCALFFQNMDKVGPQMARRISIVDASTEELGTPEGLAWLRERLSERVDYPDPRDSFGYVVARGWAGSSVALNRIGESVHDMRAVLVTDGPVYTNVSMLESASKDGGLLEQLKGEKIYHRHMIVLMNRGRVRKAFQGRAAKGVGEETDVFAEASGPWMGHYLKNILTGTPWLPHAGYSSDLAGFDGVEMDMKLGGARDINLVTKHRLNPIIRRSRDLDSPVVLWGAHTLSEADGGVQIGVGVIETLVARYAEWLMNKEGILNEVQKGRERLSRFLSEFIDKNSGPDRMFEFGSQPTVTVGEDGKSLDVELSLQIRQVTERGIITLKKHYPKPANS
jgi:hypothetical protein